jgi:hypothetical protein
MPRQTELPLPSGLDEPMKTELLDTRQQSAIVQLTPMATFRELVAQGIDPDKLGKLLDLQREWERGEAEKVFAKSKVDCKSRLPVVVKDKKGDKGIMYPSLEHVSKEIDPITTAHGFSHSYGTKPSTKPDCITVTLCVLHSCGHHEDRELVDVPYDTAGPQGKPNKTPVQGLVSSVSYAQRKLKLMYWDVTVADEDKDGNAPSDTISDKEIEDLNGLIIGAAEAHATTTKAVLDKMLGSYEIKSLEELPKIHLNDARTRLQKLIHGNH